MTKLNRRTFLKSSTALLAAPYIVPSTCFGANERITAGFIGVRNQGTGNLNAFMGAGVNIGAICDVDDQVRAKAMDLVQKKNHAPQDYTDYRKLLEQKDLDVVVITTPDHWHALMTVNACQAGKDVYCEKPLSLTIAEGRRMVRAAREHKRIVQTGTQQRSGTEFWRAASLVRNGAIGKIEKILVGIPGSNDPGQLGPDTDPPAGLNYDLWLGPAPYKPYNEKRLHYNFRFWWDYSGGQITNFGAHHLDIAQWGLGMDNSGPVAVSGTASYPEDHRYEVTDTCRIDYTYANGTVLTLGQKQDDIPQGITFVGTEGKIFVVRGAIRSTPEDLVGPPAAKGDDPKVRRELDSNLDEKILASPIQLQRSTNHAGNFLDSVKSRELPVCDVEIGHRSATVCHLGNIVARLGRDVKWNPETEMIEGDAEAQAMMDREYRSPWSHDTAFVSK
ncbi:Gfo/Idh/MocA family protein [Planctomicrobium sp. SH668]|uniref:Gfo/Idh/MocA family protein n=1 Tax=Planctomicrobium sp. SH668 TaxID=3448126 RepID=UPI003F5B8EBD